MFFLPFAILTLSALGRAHVVSRHSTINKPICLDNVTAAFHKAHIVPDVISSFNPKVGVDTLFTDPVTKANVEVVPGILLTTEQTDQPPQWSLASDRDLSNSKTTWVITIVDPDALTPQDPSIAQFLHFIGQGFIVDNSLAPNRGKNTVSLTNVSSALVEFFHPSPPAGSDPHRYVILVYVQPDDFEEKGLAYFNGTIPPGTDFREFFNITDFASKTALGEPVAGNFFLVGPDADASRETVNNLPFPFN
ncbi:hypothetical protein NP233_g836 [Leucocoprinus birnbaumii]|uniref:PEBP-like protein n=1 Tax=Leucocoprinus birnbaumii TaxID=56174 RepID=A0AAD5W3K1_9AGAR|nr:hypothetical protein NP233_g836 [Leucocoprinus birnbaumii]